MLDVIQNFVVRGAVVCVTTYSKRAISALFTHYLPFLFNRYLGSVINGNSKSYYFGGVGTKANVHGYNEHPTWDYNVGTMYTAAKVKGKISTMPKKEGVLVMTSDFGHVGVYIGNNEVVECTLSRFGDGVVKTKLSDRSWTWWCQCPCIEDDTGVTKISGTNAYTAGKTSAVVNVRETASICGKIVTKLAKGTAVQLTGKTVKNGRYTWAEILYNGKLCYCDKQWINA